MRRALLAFLLMGLTGLATPAIGSLSFYVDTAPNVYGSPYWAPWWTQTKADVVGGSFTDMRSSAYTPGTHWLNPYDEIVYSTGDLGQRLHWLYWLPETSIDEMEGNFQVKIVVDWDGVDYTYDWGGTGGLVEDEADVGWVQPGSWEEYEDGVIGSFGHAWWAADDDAEPFDTGGSPYDETDQADIDAVWAASMQYQTHATGMIRIQESGGEGWFTQELRLDVIPEPASLILLGIGLVAVAGGGVLRRRRKK